MFKSTTTPQFALQLFLLIMCFAMSQLVAASNGNKTKTKAVSSAEFEQFFSDFADALNSRDDNAVSKAIDIDTIFEIAIEKRKDSEDYKKRVVNVPREEFKEGLVSSLVMNLGENGKAKILKVTKVSKRSAEALLRMFTNVGGLQYIKLRAQSVGKQVVIIDWFNYALGANLIDNVSNVLDMLMPSTSFVGKVKDVLGDKRMYNQMVNEFADIKQSGDAKKSKQFFTKYQSIMKDDWLAMNLAQQLMVNVQQQEYHLEVLKFMDTHHGTDNRAGFLLFDYYFLTEQFGKAIESLNRYEKAFGMQDAGILYLKTLTYAQSGKSALALKSLETCQQVEPDHESCYWVAISYSMKIQDYSATIKYLNAVREKLGYEFTHESLSAEPTYANLIKSEEYANWDYIQKTK